MKQYILDEKDVKLYKRYSPVGFFYCLFALVLVAIPVVWLFIPVSTLAIETTEGIKEASITGLDLFPSLLFKQNAITELITTYKAAFGDYVFVYPIVYFIAALFMGLTCLCSAILALRILFLLLFGQARNPKAILTNAWFSAVFALLTSAIFICLQFIKDLFVSIGKADPAPINFGTDMLVYILAGAGLLAVIILSIYYAIAFRKGYYKNLVQIIETGPEEANAIDSPIFEGIGKTIDKTIPTLGGHAYSGNLDLELADIPDHITEIGASSFSNCGNLKVVIIPKSVISIGYNAFFNCVSLKNISYRGTKEEWSKIKRGSNWLSKAGTDVVKCTDGLIRVDTSK